MSAKDRAKQFAPFDALKGLHDALKIKEYENERVQKGEVDEEKANQISKILYSFENGRKVKVLYFEDGHYLSIKGKGNLKVEENIIEVDKKKISLDDLFDIELVN